MVGLFGGGFLFVDLVLFGLFLTYSEKFPKCIRWCASLSKLTCLNFFLIYEENLPHIWVFSLIPCFFSVKERPPEVNRETTVSCCPLTGLKGKL